MFDFIFLYIWSYRKVLNEMIFMYSRVIFSKLSTASAAFMRFQLAILFMGAMLFSCSILSAQVPISNADKSESGDGASSKTTKYGFKTFQLDSSIDLYSVFSNSAFSNSLKDPILSSLVLPIPIQITSDGNYIDYTHEEWNSILERIHQINSKYSIESFKNQFFNIQSDLLGLTDIENKQNILFADWNYCFLNSTFVENHQSFIKQQVLMGNVCIMDEELDVPSSKNITRDALPADSPNAMLAYMSLFNRWLFARPSRATDIMKAKQVGPEFFSDALALCNAFAPELRPGKAVKKSKS